MIEQSKEGVEATGVFSAFKFDEVGGKWWLGRLVEVEAIQLPGECIQLTSQRFKVVGAAVVVRHGRDYLTWGWR
jgi:hypothetical protein